MAAPTFPKIYVTSIPAMCLPNGEPKGILFFRNSYQVNVVRHQTIRPYVNAVSPAPFGHQVNIGGIIGIEEKSPLTPVTTLCDVMGKARGDYPCYSRHMFPLIIVL